MSEKIRQMFEGFSMIKYKLLKSALSILIRRYGIERINEQFANIFFEKANEMNDIFFDDLSEAYDNINKQISAAKKC